MSNKQQAEAQGKSIAPDTGVGLVHLSVTDGRRSAEFYQDVVGLVPMAEDEESIRMGAGGIELVALYPDATRAVVPHTSGLYHLAIVVPDRREFARVVARLSMIRYPHSPTDHTMTKADYLWDPDGNGIEVYVETPEDGTWLFTEDEFGARDTQGNIRSGRDPIDLRELFGELNQDDQLDSPMPEGTKMGHVHLHVPHLDEAVRFYRDLIGFDMMGQSRRFGAAFVSAGGYHHHLGLNTWAGVGAPPKPRVAAGLRHFTIEVPDETALGEVAGRLQSHGVKIREESDHGFFTADPSGNRVNLAVRK
jgi:catechol 2,3-dioxygenase